MTRESRTAMGKQAKRGLVILLVALCFGGGYVPEWTDYNESDPGITLTRGIDKDRTL